MTARVQVAGILSDAPASRDLKGGRQCVTATLRAKDGKNTRFWHIVAFNETVQADLNRLTDGDAVAVRGALKAELYDRNGETDLSFRVIADDVLPLRQPGKKHKKEGELPGL
jgi:single-stranded DNA-binding protein